MSGTNVVFDLIKATKNLSNLVQVQRVVTKKGKTFYQNYWVLPNQVKSTDKVLSQSPIGTFDFNKFDSLKDTDRVAAIKYAEACGISWAQSPHDGINWMRACMAAKKASGITVQQGGKPKQQSSPINKHQSTTSSTTSNKVYDLSSLSSSFDTLSGKDKVNALKTIISKDDMFNFAKNAGVTWDGHSHAGINNMRMQMALASWADSHSLADCKTYAVIKSGDNPALAKMPNKNSTPLSDDTSKTDSEPKSDKLEIPSNATDRDKAVITLINSINDKTELDMVKKLGIVAEDDKAKEYLKNTLLPNVLSAQKQESSSNSKYGNSVNAAVTDGLVKTMKGLTTTLITRHDAFDKLFRSLDSRQFTAPRSLFGLGKWCQADIYDKITDGTVYIPLTGSTSDMMIFNLFDELKKNFGEYMPEDGESIINPSGTLKGERNHLKYGAMKEFNQEKDGICVALKHIAESQPELKDTAETMRKSYLDLVALSQNNVSELDTIFTSDDELNSVREDVKEQLEASNAILDVIKQKLSKDDYDAFRHQSAWGGQINLQINSDFTIDFEIRNPYFSYMAPVDDDKNWRNKQIKIDLDSVTLSSGQNAKDYFKKRNNGYVGAIVNSEKEGHFKMIAETDIYTPQTRDKVFKIIGDFLGTEPKEREYIDTWGNKEKAKMFDVSPDEKRDAVMSNLLHMNSMANAQDKISRTIYNYGKSSKLNDDGMNYENIFDYIVSSSQRFGNKPKEYTIYGVNATNTYSSNEFLDMMKQQHSQNKVYSLSELKDLKTNLLDFTSARYSRMSPASYQYVKPNTIHDYKYIGGFNSGLDVYRNKLDTQDNNIPIEHPLYKIMLDDLSNVAVKNKAAKNARVKTDADVINVMKGNLGISTLVDADDLDTVTKEYRKKVLSAIRCSLASLPERKYQDLQHRVKIDWDQTTHRNNSAVFHGAYEIKNLAHEEAFKKACEVMKETPKQYYHGTSFEGTKGILGDTGHFRVPKNSNQVKAGSMLGYGVYLADKSSKSAQYFRGYNNGRYGCGSLMICDAILGKQMPYVGRSTSPTYDTTDGTVCATTDLNSRFSLCNNEWAVRNEDYVMPRILIDMENARRT